MRSCGALGTRPLCPSPSFTLSCRPQIIQRQLEQVEEKQRQLEERGVAVEKALRGEAGTGWAPGGRGTPEESPPSPAGG